MDIFIRDLDEDTVRILKEEAVRDGLSMNSVVRRALDRAAVLIRRRQVFAEAEADITQNGGVSNADLQAAADEQRDRDSTVSPHQAAA